jgi:hypothetical protein
MYVKMYKGEANKMVAIIVNFRILYFSKLKQFSVFKKLSNEDVHVNFLKLS